MSQGAKIATLLVTLTFVVGVRLWLVPAEFLDTGFNPTPTPGRDYYADSYTARVVANDPADMYVKRQTPQLPEEQVWSKPAASPYPPLCLLTMGAMYQAGNSLGLSYYWMAVSLEALFLLLALVYCWKTRWYLFVLLSMNVFVAWRVWGLGADSSSIMVLLAGMIALVAARFRPSWAHPLVALMIATKLTPVFYLNNFLRMRLPGQLATVAILLCGLVLPLYLIEGYSHIWLFHLQRDTEQIPRAMNSIGLGNLTEVAVALAYLVPLAIVAWFSIMLLRVQLACDWDWEDRIGWSLAPFALLFTLRVASMRMFFLAMLLPDKRGSRSIFVAIMGLVDIFMVVGGLAHGSPVRDLIWDICGLGILIVIIRIWSLQIRRSGKGPEVSVFNLRGIWNLVKCPVPVATNRGT